MLGDKFLQKQYRKKKPIVVKVSLLSLLETYQPVLTTLNYLKSGDVIVAADIDAKQGVDENLLTINIYANKEVQSRTRKD